MSYFKKGISFLSVLVLLCAITFTFSGGLKANEPDEQGIDPWLSVFHDAQNTGFSDSIAQPPFEEAWTYERESDSGRFVSKASVYNGVVYAPYSANPNGQECYLIALNIEDGEELWRSDDLGARFLIGTPIVDPENGVIYVATTTGFGLGGSTKLFALNLKDGTEEWSSDTINGSVQSSFIYADGGIYLTTAFVKQISDNKDFDFESEEGRMVKVNAEDGSVEWEIPIAGSWVFESPPAYKDGIIFATTSNFMFNSKTSAIRAIPKSKLYFVDAESGDIIQEFDGGEGDWLLAGGVCSDGDYIYTCWSKLEQDSASIVLFCLDSESGDTVWSCEISNSVSWSSTPIISDEFVFITSRDGSLIAVNKESGKKAWSKKVADITDEAQLASTKNYVFGGGWRISSDGRRIEGMRVQAFDLEAKGKSVWKEDIDDDIPNGVVIYGKYLIISGSFNIYCYESEMPELTVSPEKLEIGEIERGITKDIPVSVQNKGKEGLEGTVSADAPWIKVSPEKINDKTNELIVTIDTHGLELKEYSGNVNIVSNGGNKKIQVTITVVDKTPPTVEFDFSDLIKIGDNLYTNNKNYSLKGKTEPSAVLEIQDKEVSVDENGNFETELELKEGENIIKVKATDDVGNSGSQELKIFLDTTPPNVMLATENYTLSKEPNIYIMGQVDDKDATVTINGDKVDLAANGSFAVLVFLKKGENLFEIKATDKIDNEKVIKLVVVYPENALIVLYVGKKTGEVNAKTVNLDVAPFIHKKTGRTMVPLRFIGEALGAKVDWDNAERKVTYTLYGKKIELWIDKATALVNGNPVVVDPSPYIVSGRTVVPLRFVSENLGASVEWDSKSQRITIRFPAP